MLRRRHLLLPLLALAAAVGAARADIPRKINFQGRLADAAGTPKTGVFAMTFRLFTASAGGTACHDETQTSVPVNSGLFSTVIGGASGISTACTFATQHWLEVQVGTDPPMTPRVPLVAVAYSMTAAAIVQGAATYAVGNAFGNIPVNNNVMSVGLNAEMIGGRRLSDLLARPIYSCNGSSEVYISCPAGTTATVVGYASN
jgi:hypothetical protein